MTGGSLLRRNRFPYRLFLKVIPLHAVKAVSYEIGMARVRLTHRRTDPRFKPGSGCLVTLAAERTASPDGSTWIATRRQG